MNRIIKRIVMIMAVFLFLADLAVEAAEIVSVSYGRHGMIYEGQAAGVNYGDAFKVMRGETEIGIFIASNVSRDVTVGDFEPISEEYMPLIAGDVVVRTEKVDSVDKIPAPLNESGTERIPDEKTFTLFVPTGYVEQNTAAGIEYQSLGTIGRVSSFNYSVNADIYYYEMSSTIDDFRVSLIRQDCSLEKYSVLGIGTKGILANIVGVKYALKNSNTPGGRSVALGNFSYFDGSGIFSQPYLAVSRKYGFLGYDAGINWFMGDVPSEIGLFASLKYQLAPGLTAFSAYSSRDFRKTVINHMLLPRVGILCTSCSSDSFTMGLSYSVNEYLDASVSIFDVFDLESFSGHVAYKKNVRWIK